jgi:hypothetical protein
MLKVVYVSWRRRILNIHFSILIISMLTISMLSLTSVYSFHPSESQLMPVPPPAPDSTEQVQDKGTSNDTMPPLVNFLTTELYAGKNVLKVNVTDDSGLRLREVRFVHEGKIESQDLVYDGNNVYKGLINVSPPSAVIVVNVNDVYGNKASYSKSFPVKQFPDIFTEMFNRLINR